MTPTFSNLLDQAFALVRREPALSLRPMWARCKAWHANRSTRTALSALDERTLRDIGVPRTEIAAVSYQLGALRRRHLARQRGRP